jgi:hypothetical protein
LVIPQELREISGAKPVPGQEPVELTVGIGARAVAVFVFEVAAETA